MRFKSITIHNMFAYHSSHSISFPDNSKNQNVTVLMGRNGYGKTSFINCMKMLFADTSEEIRRTVQRKRTPTPKQFVMGISHEWWGILNKKAREKDDFQCYVSVAWVDEEGIEVNVKREWILDYRNNNYESFLKIESPFVGQIEGDEAEKFLEAQLPRNYVPFFFFDGEEVQAIAESNDSDNIKTMELLLNIRPIENMRDVLQELIRSWKREANSAESEFLFRDKERSLEKKSDERSIYQQKYDDVLQDIEETEYQIQKNSRQLKLLQGDTSSKEKEYELKAIKNSAEDQKIEFLEQIANHWKRDAFVITNRGLFQRLIKKLEPVLNSSAGEQKELLTSVKNRMHVMLESAPFPSPKLSQGQVGFYKKRITKELEALSVADSDIEGIDLAHEQASKLYRQLTTYEENPQLIRDLILKTE